jgi:prepilin-type N-terminal cleavage/methylation domain-containing protein/prepilin-type processing-associated H-X9-DG protein
LYISETIYSDVGPKSMARRFLRAFTIIELLVVVVLIAVLAFVLLPALSKAKAKAMRIHCVGNLKNVGLAHRIFATDNGELFPWERSAAVMTNQINFPNLTGLSAGDQAVRIYQSVSNELSTPKIIACPADVREPADNWLELATNNITYFVGLSAREGLWQTFLAGDRNLVLDGNELTGRVELKSGAHVAWDKNVHRFQGNVAMGDGSVQQLSSGPISSSGRLREALKNTGFETNALLIP